MRLKFCACLFGQMVKKITNLFTGRNKNKHNKTIKKGEISFSLFCFETNKNSVNKYFRKNDFLHSKIRKRTKEKKRYRNLNKKTQKQQNLFTVWVLERLEKSL